MANVGSSSASRAYYIPQLTASNYTTWSIKVEMLLVQSKLWTVVDNTEVAPPAFDIDGLLAWQLKDSKAKFDILLHCGKKQLFSMCPLQTSKEVWDCIKQLYERSN